MRAFFGIVLTLGLLLSSIAGVSAQQGDTGFAHGLNQPVTFESEEDGIVATLTVNAVHDNFADHEPDAAPEYGYRYVLVEFTIQNLDEMSAEIGWSGFSVISDFGRASSFQYMESTDEGLKLFREDLTLDAGESVDVAQVYQIPTHAQPAFFSWAWSTDYQVMIDLGAEPQERSAFAYGPDSTAVYTDDFGNPVASMQVTSLNTELDGYTTAALEEGDTFAAAHITFTNLTDRQVVVSAYRMDILDSSGTFWGSSYLRADEGVEPVPFRGELYLAPGESVDVMIAFNITGASDLIGVRWAPKWSDTTIHFFEEQGNQVSATPQATPGAD